MQKLRKKRMRVRRRILIVIGVGIVVLITGLIFASRIERIRIQNISVEGNQIIDTEDVTSIVEKRISGAYAYVIPRNNIFLYPKESIRDEIARTYPRFSSVVIDRVGTTGIRIRVSEERGTALWCGSDIQKTNNASVCYFTDTVGLVIDSAPYYSGNVYVRFFGGTIDGENSPLGKSFIDQETFTELMDFTDAVAKLGFPVYAVLLGPDTEYSLLLDLGGTQMAVLRFRANADYVLLKNNLTSALTRTDLTEKLAKERAFLQYFDLRFSNKVYYKFLTPGTTATPTTPAE